MPFQQAAVQWFFRMHIHVGHMPSYQQLCLTLKGVLAGCPPTPDGWNSITQGVSAAGPGEALEEGPGQRT